MIILSFSRGSSISSSSISGSTGADGSPMQCLPIADMLGPVINERCPLLEM